MARAALVLTEPPSHWPHGTDIVSVTARLRVRLGVRRRIPSLPVSPSLGSQSHGQGHGTRRGHSFAVTVPAASGIDHGPRVAASLAVTGLELWLTAAAGRRRPGRSLSLESHWHGRVRAWLRVRP